MHEYIPKLIDIAIINSFKALHVQGKETNVSFSLNSVLLTFQDDILEANQIELSK